MIRNRINRFFRKTTGKLTINISSTNIRFSLVLIAILLIIVGVIVGDPNLVREFANYDWARKLGY